MAASAAILPLVKKLGYLLYDEANYLLQVKPEVESLHNDLMLMTAYLKGADAIHNKNDLAKEWVRQLRHLAFEAEDAIDFFLYEMVQKPRDSVVRKITKMCLKPINAHRLRWKIQEINGKIRKLKEDRLNFEINPLKEAETSAAHTHQLEEASSEAEKLAKLLMEELAFKPFGVVSITGMRGLGKSTLAETIYNRDDVKNHFGCRAFVRISKEYEVRDVLCNIIEQVIGLTEDWRSKRAEYLKGKLSDFLKEKKNYLFVFDDVWRTKDWDNLKGIFPFPCNGQQCRVLLTTRDERVARHADPTPPWKIRFFDPAHPAKNLVGRPGQTWSERVKLFSNL